MHPLTDAFIKGRTKFKKIQNSYFETKGKKVVGACHLAAIYWGMYNRTDIPQGAGPVLVKDFPEIYSKFLPVPCEDSSEKEGHITSILIHLNDQHDGRSGWTDKAVADWLEKALTT